MQVYFKQAYVDSMIELKRRYRQALKEGITKKDLENREGYKCLLCHPIGVETSRLDRFRSVDGWGMHRLPCDCCPWTFLSKLDYDEVPCQPLDDGAQFIFTTTNPKRIKARICQLDRWIKEYREAEELNESDIM